MSDTNQVEEQASLSDRIYALANLLPSDGAQEQLCVTVLNLVTLGMINATTMDEKSGKRGTPPEIITAARNEVMQYMFKANRKLVDRLLD